MLLHPISWDIEGPYRAPGWRRCLARCAGICQRLGITLFARPM